MTKAGSWRISDWNSLFSLDICWVNICFIISFERDPNNESVKWSYGEKNVLIAGVEATLNHDERRKFEMKIVEESKYWSVDSFLFNDGFCWVSAMRTFFRKFNEL